MNLCFFLLRPAVTVSVVCLTAILCVAPSENAWAQQSGISVVPTISTIAGNGTAGYGGDGGPATDGSLNGPSATAVDKKGNVYIADTYDSRIRKIDTNGIISTIAGNGNCLYSGDGGPAENATVCQPYGIAVDQAGKIYIADTVNNRIREIATNGTITTIAGNGNGDFSGDGGPATSAGINAPTGIAVDSTNHIYIADRGNYRIRKIDPNGTISTIAGNGTSGFSGDDGPALNASFNTVWSVAVDGAGNIFVADIYNARIRKINSNGIISTIAGSSYGFSGDGGSAINAQLSNAYGVAADGSGNVYFADTYNHRIRVISSSGTIATIAGDGTGAFGGDGGPATQAQLNNPYGVTVDADGNVYIADLNNQRIRKLGPSDIGPTPPQPIPSFGAIPVGQSSAQINVSLKVNEALTITSVSVPPSEGVAQEYTLGPLSGCSIGTATAAGAVCVVPITFSPGYPGLRGVPLVAVTTVGTFRFGLVGVGLGPQVTISPGVMQTVAGSGSGTFSGDNGPATSAGMLTPSGTARDNAGNLYIATFDKRIRKVAPDGTITTFAGTGTACSDPSTSCGDGGPAASATFIQPQNIALDAAGNLYISDANAYRVRKVDANGIVTTVAGNGTVCADPSTACGDGGPATSASFAAPYGVAIDANGNLYIADEAGQRIRKVSPSGTITTIAGTGTQGFSGDNGIAVSANLNSPFGVAIDVYSNLYFSDAGNQRIRKVDSKTGVITTVAGGGSSTTIPVDGIQATSVALSFPTGISLDPGGNLYIADFGSHNVAKVDLATGIIRGLAGTLGSAGFSGDAGSATAAKLNRPVGLALDSFGQVYVADSANNRVRQISATAAPVSFPDTATGQTSSSQTVYVSNIGNRNLTFSGVSAAGDFVVDPSGNCISLSSLGTGATCSAPLLFDPQQPGPRTGNVVATDDALNAAGSTQTVALRGNGLQIATATALSLSTSNTIVPGTPVTLTATVAPNKEGAVTASGTISFYDGATLLQAQPVTPQGSASITVTSFTTPGTHPLTAVYSGDTNFLTSTSPISNLIVDAAATVTLSSSANPIRYGDMVTFTASVPPGSTGTIQFKLGTDNIGIPISVVNDKASVQTSSLGIGPHVVSAVYTNGLTRGDTPSDNLVQLVQRAVLTVKANDLSRPYSQPNGTLGYTITGFVGTDNEASSVTGTPLLVTDAIPATPVGTYPIVARQGSLSSTPYTFQFANGTLTVTKATPSPTDMVLTTSANPAVWGQTIKLTAQLPAHATGQVVFMDGATVLGTATAANSVAVLSTAQLAVGGHPITAVYAGDSNYGGTTSVPLNQEVFKATLNVVASDAQRIYGQPNPDTTYSFSGFVNGDTAATVTGVPNLTTVAVPASPVGGYPIIATAGSLASANYTFKFIEGRLSITPATPGGGSTSAIVLTSSLNPSQFGNAVVFTASLPARATGTVNFVDGPNVLGVGAVVSDAASITTSSLAIGTHPVTAVYSGDKNYLAGSSAVLSQIVNKAVTVVTVASSLNPAFVGNTITFTAAVPTSATGTVDFRDGTTSLGVATITPGTPPALSTNRLLSGTHSITASYSGDGSFSAASSAALLQSVNRLTPPLTETSSLNPAPVGTAITLTATVPAAATGTVSFYEGSTLLGTAQVNNGNASITTSSLAPGTHAITAVYSGDANYTTVTVTGLSEVVVVSLADFTVSSSTGRQLIPPGASATFAIVVGSMNGSFTNSVSMSASNLPSGASYTFSPATVTPGTSGANTNFVVSVPKQSAVTRSTASGSLAFALLFAPLIFIKRYRKKPYRLLLWSLIALSSFHALTGCGTGGYFSQPEQTYSITVTGTSGSIAHSTTVSLTVE